MCKASFTIFKILLVSIFLGFFFNSCGGNKEDGKDDDSSSDTVKTSVVSVGGELFSVPSPIQTALLIQKLGIAYDKNNLSQSNKVNTFSTDFSRALNLGIYGADLGYVALYEQTQDAIKYLASIKQLSDKLGLSSAFDGPTLERLQNNLTNKDSMMVLVGVAYRGSDEYLKSNNRSDISTLILTGGWVESMHFSVMAYKAKSGDQIRYRIAEQKQGLSSLVKILGGYNSPEIAEINVLMADLLKVFDGIKFKYQYVEPITDSVKKVTYINSTSEVIVSDDQLNQIAVKIGEIRNKIISTTKS